MHHLFCIGVATFLAAATTTWAAPKTKTRACTRWTLQGWLDKETGLALILKAVDGRENRVELRHCTACSALKGVTVEITGTELGLRTSRKNFPGEITVEKIKAVRKSRKIFSDGQLGLAKDCSQA